MKPRANKAIVKESNMNLYSWAVIADGFLLSPAVKKYIGAPLRRAMLLAKDDYGQWAVDMDSWSDLGRRVNEKLENETLKIAENLKSHFIRGRRVSKLADDLFKANLSNWPNKHFISWFRKSWADFMELNALGYLAVVSDFEHNILTTRLASILEKHATPENPTQSYLSILVSSDRPDWNWDETRELLAIVMRYKTLAAIKNSLEFKKHVSHWCWLNYGYQGPKWTAKDFAERVKKILRAPIEQRGREHQNHFQTLRKRQNEIEKKLRFTPHEKYLFAAARTLMFMKAYRICVRHKIHYAYELAFQHLAKRFGIPIHFFRYGLREEIIALLSGKKVKVAEVVERRKLLLQITEGGKQWFVPQAKINKVWKDAMQIEEKVSQSEVQGQAAFLGKARGKAKLVFGPQDMKKVNRGDILIAVATMPDLLPAMHRAAAFVTEQGGITSHAAIVAREMKKPCVIGTKFATKVFKDGDWIEVDANKGLVRKV